METRTSQAATDMPVVGELERRLDSLRQSIRRTTFIGGTAFAIRLACLCLIAAFAIDLFWDAPRFLRIGLLLATVAAVAVVVFLRVLRPTFRRIGHDELAALVESAHPEMEERLLSSLELARSADRESVKGSPMMRQMLLRETATVAREVEFEDVVDSSAAVRQTVIACVTFLLVLCPFLVLQDGYGNLWARFFNPWGNYSHGTTLTLEVLPGDAVVPRGEDVSVVATPHFRFARTKLLTGGRVRWIDDEGESEFRDLKPVVDEGTYTAVIPQVSRGLRYRVESDQGSSREFRVEVVERPTITGLTVDVQPPAYCGKAAQRIDGLVGETAVFERSRLKFTATFNKPVAEVRWLWIDDVRHKYDGKPLEAKGRDRLKSASLPGLQFARDDAKAMAVDADGLSASWELTADREGAFEIVLLDSAGIQNRHEPGRMFRILRDAAPTVAWADNETHPTARPDDVVAFEVAATDDIGLGALELHYAVLPHRTQAGVFKTEAALLGGQEFATRFAIDLRKLTVPEGALIAVKSRATDERPIPAPNEAWTSERVISISRDAAAFGSSELNQRHQRIRDLLAALRQEASAREEDAAALKQQAKDAQQKGLQEQAFKSEADQLSVREQQLRERLEQTAAEFQREGMIATLSPKLSEIADQNVAPAVSETEKARDAATTDGRAPALQKAEQQLGEATHKLTQVEQRFEELAKIEKDLLELNRVADKTERLANDVADFEQKRRELAKTEGSTPQEKQQASAAQKDLEAQRKQLQQEQKELSKNLQDVLNRRPEVVEAARADLIERLKNLGQRAEQLAGKEDRLSQAMKKAGDENAESLKQEAQHQQQLSEQVKQLAAQVAGEQRQRLVPLPDLSRADKAAEHLQKGNPQAAAASQRKAAEELEQLAKAIEQNQQLPADSQKAAEALAKRQQEIREQLDSVLKQARDAKQQRPAEELTQLAAEQAALQAATAQLEVPISNEGRRNEAIKEGGQALEEMLSEKPEQALAAAERARSKLEQLAKEVGTPEERTQRLARDADHLRKEQESIARELEQKRDDDRAHGRKPGSDPNALADQLRKQEDVARKAAAMDVATAPDPSKAAQQQSEAIQAAAEALQKTNSGNAEEAAPAARKAQQALSDLERTLKNEPTAGEQLERLVKEQRDLAEAARQALANNDPKAIEQAQSRQQKQAEQLQRLDAPQADRLAKDAAERAGEAAKDLAAAKDDEARRPRAQTSVQEAGQALEQLANDLQPTGSPAEQARQLADQQQQRAQQAAQQAGNPSKALEANPPAAQMATSQLAVAQQAVEQLPAPAAPEQKQNAAKTLEAARQSQQKLAEALRQQPADAAEPSPELKAALDDNAARQQSAADALGQLADQLAKPESQQALTQDQQQAAQLARAAQNPIQESLAATAQSAARLAQEQEKVREKTSPLIDGLADKGQQKTQMEQARQAQQKLAEKAESLNPAADPLARANAQAHTRAAEKALAAGDARKAAADQAAAQQSFEQLARSAQAQQSQLAQAAQQPTAGSEKPSGETDPMSNPPSPAADSPAAQASRPDTPSTQEKPSAEQKPSTSPRAQPQSPTPAEQLARQARALAQAQRQAAEELMRSQPAPTQLASADGAEPRNAMHDRSPSTNPAPSSEPGDKPSSTPTGPDAPQKQDAANQTPPPSQSPMSPMSGQPMSAQPMPAQPTPRQSPSEQPMPGPPMSERSKTDQPNADQPMPGQTLPMEPMPGQPMQGQPMPGQLIPGPGAPMGKGAPSPGTAPASAPPQPGVPGPDPGGTEPGASSPGGAVASPMGQPSSQPAAPGQSSPQGQPGPGQPTSQGQPSSPTQPSSEPGSPTEQPSQPGQPSGRSQPMNDGQPSAEGQPSSQGQPPRSTQKGGLQSPESSSKSGPQTPGAKQSGQSTPAGQQQADPQNPVGEPRTPAEAARDAVAAQQQVSRQLANAALEAATQAQGTPLAEAASKMAKSAAQASEDASVGATAQAADAGRELARQANELARQLSESPVAQGGPQPELAERMRDLANQQEAASGQLSQIGQDREARNAAQSQGQQQLKQETQQLEKEFAELSEQLRAQPVDRKRQSEQARDGRSRSEGASKEMQNAMHAARQGDSGEAAEAARAAAEELRRAAGMAREERVFEPEKSPNNPVPNETGSQVAEAARELQKAGEMLSENQPQNSAGQPSDKPGDKSNKTEASQESAKAKEEGQGEQPAGPMMPEDGGNEGLAEGQDEGPPQASEMLKQGAHSLRKAASQLKLRPGKSDNEGQPDSGGEQGESQPTSGQQKQGSASGANEQVRIVDVEAHLEKLSTRNWGELPGKLQTEILQSTRRRPDGDYAPLIRRYFDSISKSQATGDRRED